MEIETRHLRLVKAIADAGSISGAAPMLGSTQPALTRQLRRIETGLGGELFTRSRDGAEPTSLGRLVVGRAEAVLSVIDSLRADVADATQGSAPSEVRIGVRTGPVLMGLIDGLRATLPAADIVTDSESRIGGLLDLVATGCVDIAVVHEFEGFEIPLDPRLVATPVRTEDVLIAMSETHPMAAWPEIDLRDLEAESWLLSPLDVDREADAVSAACAAAGFTPNIVHYVNDTLGYELIRAGEAISDSLPRTPPPGIVTRPLTGSPVRVRHLMLCERQSPLLEHVDKLVKFVGDALQGAATQATDPTT